MIDMDGGYPVVAQRARISDPMLVACELTCPWIEVLQTRVAAEPQSPILIFGDVIILFHPALRIAFIYDEALSSGVKAIETIPRCKPHHTSVVGEYSDDRVVAQARRVGGIVTERLELSGPAVETVQSLPV